MAISDKSYDLSGLNASTIRACKTGKFPLRLIETIMEILTIITKRLITIIIISFDNNKRFDYNKNRWNITKKGGNNKF